VDGRADQYALACVAYQLLTGQAPFERDQGMAVMLAHLSEPPPSLVARRPDLPAAVDEVLAQGMAKVPEKRFGCCSDFVGALREALGLAPYDSRGTVPVQDHPPTVIAGPPPQSSGPGPDGKTADPAAVVTMDSLPSGSKANVRTADQLRPTRRRGRILALALACTVVAGAAITGSVLASSGHPSASSSTRPTTLALAASPGTTAQLSPTANRTSHSPSTSPTRRPTTQPTTAAPATSPAAPRPTPTQVAAPADQYTISGAATQYSCADLNSYGFSSKHDANVRIVNNTTITIQVLDVEGHGQFGGFTTGIYPGTDSALIGPAVGEYLEFVSDESRRCLAVGRVTGSGEIIIT